MIDYLAACQAPNSAEPPSQSQSQLCATHLGIKKMAVAAANGKLRYWNWNKISVYARVSIHHPQRSHTHMHALIDLVHKSRNAGTGLWAHTRSRDLHLFTVEWRLYLCTYVLMHLWGVSAYIAVEWFMTYDSWQYFAIDRLTPPSTSGAIKVFWLIAWKCYNLRLYQIMFEIKLSLNLHKYVGHQLGESSSYNVRGGYQSKTIFRIATLPLINKFFYE